MVDNGSPQSLSQVQRHRSKGITVPAALVCLVVIMAFTGMVVRALVLQRRRAQWDEHRLQCLFIVESAIDRAQARLDTQPDYEGETWEVELEDRGRSRKAVTQIRVERVSDSTAQRRIEVRAIWPDDPVFRVQHIQSITTTLTNAGAPL
jgi:Tfp pilus assembly protein PilX